MAKTCWVILRLPLLGLAVSACSSSVCRGKEVAAARTAAEERAALTAVWKSCKPLSVSFFDATGARVGPEVAKLRSIEVRGGGEEFHHALIDPSNVQVLLLE